MLDMQGITPKPLVGLILNLFDACVNRFLFTVGTKPCDILTRRAQYLGPVRDHEPQAVIYQRVALPLCEELVAAGAMEVSDFHLYLSRTALAILTQR